MIERIVKLEKRIRELYEEKNLLRDTWADWFYEHHVFVVADKAVELAKRFGANEEYARAAGMLHDIADVHVQRQDDAHEQESLNIAKQLLEAAGYSDDETSLIVDDAIRYHSCHGNEKPSSLEGQVLATADALAHLQTDFYVFAAWKMGNEDRALEGYKQWVLKKLDRDYYSKILFEDVRKEATNDYENLKTLFSR